MTAEQMLVILGLFIMIWVAIIAIVALKNRVQELEKENFEIKSKLFQIEERLSLLQSIGKILEED